MDALRASALPQPDPEARRGLPPASLAAVRLPPGPAHGRADQAAAGVAPAAYAPGFRGLPVRQTTRPRERVQPPGLASVFCRGPGYRLDPGADQVGGCGR